MMRRTHDAPQRDAYAAEPAELIEFRLELLRKHNLHLPEDDPICIQFTMLSQIVDSMLDRIVAERRETVEEVRVAVASVMGRRAQLRAGTTEVDAKAVADRITAELFDDLSRTSRQVLKEAKRTFLIIGAVVLAVSFGVLYLANHRLAEARSLFDREAQHAPQRSQTTSPPRPGHSRGK